MTAELFTASWSALYRRRDQLDVQPVRISRGVPKFWPAAERFPAVELLMPEGWALAKSRREPDWTGFEAAYRHKLDAAGVYAIRRLLTDLAADGRPCVLACFERERADCHRGQFATWWQDRTSEPIEEWQPEPNLANTPPPDVGGQLRLDVDQPAPRMGAERGER